MKRLIIFFTTFLLISVTLDRNNFNIINQKAYAQKKAKKGKKKKREKKFALNFKDADISEFLSIMSKLIGKNIILDDKVRGRITITSPRKIPVSQAYDLMKTILEVKGLSVVETKNLIKIVPIADAMRKNVEIIIDGKTTEIKPKKEKTITYLLEFKNADAAEISNTLKTLKSKYTTIVVHKALNLLIFSGSVNEVEGLIKIAKALDKNIEEDEEKPGAKGNIHVVHLENANSDQLAEVLSRVPFSETAKIDTTPVIKRTRPKSRRSKRITRSPSPRRKKKTQLSIISNKDTNSLIITATLQEFRQIKRLIKELDTVREQVLIEALIVEIGVDNGWGFGINWMLGYKSGEHLYGGSSIMGTPPDYSNMTLDGKQLVVPLASGLQLGYLNDSNVLGFALLNATGSKSNINILSTPQILTIDNQEAELNVGEEIPVQSNTRITETNTTFNTWAYKPVGIKLKLTPHITKHKKITLDLYMEVNTVLAESDVKPPKLGKRDIKTKVTVLDGKTIVVGGLIRNHKSIEEIKVPVLGDIPLLGWLFKRKTVSYSKTNLLVFITPFIVTKQEKIDRLTRQKKQNQKTLKNY